MHKLIIIFLILNYAFVAAQSNKEGALQKASVLYEKGKDAYYYGDYSKAGLLFDSCMVFRALHLKSPHKDLYSIYLRVGKNHIKQRNIEASKIFIDSAYVQAVALYGERSEEIVSVIMEKAIIASKEMLSKQAMEWNQKAIAIMSEKYGEHSLEVAGIVMNSAIDLYKQGDFRKCIQLNEYVLEIYQKELKKDDENFNRVYNNVAMAYRKVGDLEKALTYGLKAVEIKLMNYREDHPSVAKYYANIGRVLTEMKRYEEAEKYYKKALEITSTRSGNGSADMASFLGDMAIIFADNGNYEKAQPYFEQSVAILEENGIQKASSYIAGKTNLALCTYELGNKEEGILKLLEVKNMLEEKFPTEYYQLMDCYFDLSWMYRNNNEYESGLQFLNQAKDLGQRQNLVVNNDLLTVQILLEESKYFDDSDIHSLQNAAAKIDSIIQYLVSMRRSYQGERSKSFMNEKLEEIFESAVALNLKIYQLDKNEGHLASLYIAVEKAKAASFWDIEDEENAFRYGKVPEHLIAGVLRIKNKINEITYAAEREQLSPKEFQDSFFVFQGLLDEKLKMLEEDFPAYFMMKYGFNVPGMEELQNHLPKEFGVLDYYILEDGIVSISILQKDKNVFFHPLTEKENDFLETIRIGGPGGKNVEESKELYRLFFEEQDKWFQQRGVKRVTIVPHKIINYISFDQLRDFENQIFIINRYAFSYQYNSASLVRPDIKKQVNMKYAGFAPFWLGVAEEQSNLNSFRNFLAPLPGAINEVEEVSVLLGGEKYLSERASEQKFKEEGSNYGILHFATHAYIDPDNESNSCLYLSQPSGSGLSAEDGNLYIDEILSTEINASLVLLSACNTGNGRLKSGEGVMSLSRAFRYAGAESLLMSLWLANDQSSTPIIKAFMKNLKGGMTKDVALQKAKLQYLERVDPLLQDDFYWAGFLLNGDLSPLGKERKYVFMYLGLFGILLVGGLFYFVKNSFGKN